ncbi:MAG: protein phosphatase CheZ [Deltaproteobacteria bacterium]|nr:protein phosphatase CheZ [Deltaproteobacteria bacterium]
MSGNLNEVLNKLREELSSLASFIDKTRQGIDNLETTVKIGSERFPEASNQLSAVTGELENAANKIMTILEGLMSEQERADAVLKRLSEWAARSGAAGLEEGQTLINDLQAVNIKTRSEMMDIFASMSFQDLTGQKLKKVIGSLAVVEKKLLEMALSFGLEGIDIKDAAGTGAGKNEMPINQDIVDRLLKELGA